MSTSPTNEHPGARSSAPSGALTADDLYHGRYITWATHCPRCIARGHIVIARDTPLRCAFTPAGEFVPEHWHCASFSTLIQRAHAHGCVVERAETGFAHAPLPREGGYIVLTWGRYTSTLTGAWVLSGATARALTLADVESAIALFEATPVPDDD